MHLDPTWVIVADGQAARFFWRAHWNEPLEEVSNLSDSADILEKRVAVSPPSNLATYETLPKRQRQAREDDDKTFLRRVATSIDRTLTDHPAAGLILCAPARELRLLRDYISDGTRAKLSCEVARDLVHEEASTIDLEVRRLKV